MQPHLFTVELFHDDRNFWQTFHRNILAFGQSPFRLLRLGSQYKRFSETFTPEDFTQALHGLNSTELRQATDAAVSHGEGCIALVDQRYLKGLPKTRSPLKPAQLFLCGWPDTRPDLREVQIAERYFGCPVTGFLDAALRVSELIESDPTDAPSRHFTSEDRTPPPAVPEVFAGKGEVCTQLLKATGTQSAAKPQRSSSNAKRKHVMFVTSNGVGLGHLSRCLSAARRLNPDAFSASFASISRGVPLVGQFGFDFDYIAGPHPDLAGTYDWDRHLFGDLIRHADRTGAQTLVFDGNFPYAGLRHFINAGHIKNAIWIRRALWRREHKLPLEDLEKPFSLVVEPDDVAAHFDYGATRVRQPFVAQVPPVTLMNPEELLSKSDARQALGLRKDGLIGVLQIGALSNNRNGEITKDLIQALRAQASANGTPLELIWIANPIADPELAQEAAALGLTVLSRFPLQDVAQAFDFAILGGGYNSVHETLQSAVPAVFIPNEGGMMDAQRLRVDWLAHCGAAEVLRAHEYGRVQDVAKNLLSTQARAEMHEALKSFEFTNGAADLSDVIQSVACSL